MQNEELLRQLQKLTNVSKTASLNDLHDLTVAFVAIVKELKITLEKSITENKGETNTNLNSIYNTFKESEATLQTLIENTRKSSATDIKTLAKQLRDEISNVELQIPLLPEMPDVIALEKRLGDRIDAIKILTLKEVEDELPNLGVPIRDGLQKLKKDERLDSSAIKGLSKREGKLSESIINRAIGIVDQRTSFLINKVSTLRAEVDALEFNPDLNIGDLIGSATAGSVFFAGTSGALAQDNVNLFWDDTNNRLGIGNTAPSGRLSVTLANRTTDYVSIHDSSSNSYGLYMNGSSFGTSGRGFMGNFKYNNTTAGSSLPNATTADGIIFDDGTHFYSNSGLTGNVAFTPSERMTILNSGNVGIGTTGPGATLHIQKSGAELFVDNTAALTGGAVTPFIELHNNGNWGALAAISASGNIVNDNKMYLGAWTGSAYSTGVTIQQNGNVGIGTTGPGAKLHVYGSGNTILGEDSSSGATGVSATQIIARGFAAGYGAGITFQSKETGTNTYLSQATIEAEGSGNWSSVADASSFLRFSTINAGTLAEKMRILANGNVGIGTTEPTAVLHLKAGVAGANGAPFKLTAGTLLTTPELGAIEFVDNGTTGHLYVTVNIATVLTRVQII